MSDVRRYSRSFVQQTNDLEYRLTSDIRSLTTTAKAAIGFGEINEQQTAPQARRSFDALRQQLERTYTVRSVSLSDSTIAPDVKVLIFAGTPDSLRGRSEEHTSELQSLPTISYA